MGFPSAKAFNKVTQVSNASAGATTASEFIDPNGVTLLSGIGAPASVSNTAAVLIAVTNAAVGSRYVDELGNMWVKHTLGATTADWELLATDSSVAAQLLNKQDLPNVVSDGLFMAAAASPSAHWFVNGGVAGDFVVTFDYPNTTYMLDAELVLSNYGNDMQRVVISIAAWMLGVPNVRSRVKINGSITLRAGMVVKLAMSAGKLQVIVTNTTPLAYAGLTVNQANVRWSAVAGKLAVSVAEVPKAVTATYTNQIVLTGYVNNAWVLTLLGAGVSPVSFITQCRILSGEYLEFRGTVSIANFVSGMTLLSLTAAVPRVKYLSHGLLPELTANLVNMPRVELDTLGVMRVYGTLAGAATNVDLAVVVRFPIV